MTTRQKGNRSELRAVKELERDGWLVYRVKGPTKFNKNVDIFGLFDIIAKRPLKRETKNLLTSPSDPDTIWLQIKTNKKPPLGPYTEFKKKHCSLFERVEVWVWHDRKGFKKHRC